VDEEYLERVEFYIDPERKLYQAFGFNWKLGTGSSEESKKIRWSPFIMKEYARTHKSEPGKDYDSLINDSLVNKFPWLKLEDFVFRKYVKDDDPGQQGGDVTLDKNGNLIKIYAMDNVFDRPSIDQLLA